MKSKFIYSLIIVSVLLSCTWKKTTTSEKKIILNISADSLTVKLDSLITCEKTELQGLEIKTNNFVKSEFDAKFINSKNIPTDSDKLMKLGKKIAITLKQALKNKNDFDNFKIFFITKVVNQNVIGDTKNENYTAYTYCKEIL